MIRSPEARPRAFARSCVALLGSAARYGNFWIHWMCGLTQRRQGLLALEPWSLSLLNFSVDASGPLRVVEPRPGVFDAFNAAPWLSQSREPF